jgi:hypothetical protein
MPESQEFTPELKSKPIVPLENRISRLGYVELNNESMTTMAISQAIGTYENWVIRKIREFDITPEINEVDAKGGPIKVYPPIILELMKDEREWYELYKSLPSYVSAYVVAKSIGRSYGWTRKTLESLDDVRPKKSEYDREVFLYPKKAIKTLREIDLLTPMDDGWLTLKGISDLTGQDRNWIEKRLSEFDASGELRRSAISGRIFMHYPQDTVEYITETASKRSPYGKDWLTSHRMVSLLPKSRPWVNKILDTEFSELGETRQDDQGVDRVHYPPEVFAELKKRAKELSELKEADDYIPIYVLARKVGKSVLWVTNRLDIAEIIPETRLDKKGRPNNHYSPTTVEKLLDLPQDVLKIKH